MLKWQKLERRQPLLYIQVGFQRFSHQTAEKGKEKARKLTQNLALLFLARKTLRLMFDYLFSPFNIPKSNFKEKTIKDQ